MSDYIVETIESKPSALIYSPEYFFAGTFLVERLIALGITVRVLTLQKDIWKESLSHLLPHNDVEIMEPSENQTIGDYVFDLSFFGNRENNGNIDIKGNIRVNLAPLTLYARDVSNADISSSSYHFSLGDLYGPRMKGTEGVVAKILVKAVMSNTIPNLPPTLDLFPTFAPYAIDRILKYVMTSAGKGNPVGVSSKGVDYARFKDIICRVLPEVKVSGDIDVRNKSFNFPDNLQVIEVPFDQDSLVVTLTWLQSNKKNLVVASEKDKKLGIGERNVEKIQPEKPIQIPKIAPIQISKSRIGVPVVSKQKMGLGRARRVFSASANKKTEAETISRKNKNSLVDFKLKRLLVFFFLLLSLVITPIVSFLVGSVLVLFSIGNIESVQTGSGTAKLVDVGSALTGFGKNWFIMWSSYPLVGKYAQWGVGAADSIEKALSVQKSVIRINKSVDDIVRGMIGREEYPLNDYSRELSLELKKLDENLGFLEAATTDSRYYNLFLKNTPFWWHNNANLRNLARAMSILAADLPNLLGVSKPQTYMVILQNNLELRPTGGVLVSYGLFTFDSGRLVNTEISSVQDADTQLKGYVEPPEPLAVYLGEQNWKLRDANWDPNFASSAQKIEWFLDKELSRSVNGVIALDVEFLRRTIPLLSASAQMEVDDKNLFEVLHNQSLGPAGEARNIQLLTQLLQSFFEDLSVGKVDIYKLSEHVLSGLQEKHVLLFLHDTSSHRALADLGYTGEVGVNLCFGNCFSDLVGVYEANVGANTADKAVAREMSFQMGVGEKGVRRSLTISLANTSQNKNNLEDLYKTYIRVVAPADAIFGDVVISSQTQRKTQSPDIVQSGGLKEAGVFVEVSPESQVSVAFSWETLENVDFKKEGEYVLSWLKQPGTFSDPVSVRLSFPKELKVTPSFSHALTEGNVVGYNTDLDTDLLLKAKWQ